MTPKEAITDPYIFELLGLRDEYSEKELEDALIRHLESFLLEFGGDFAFIARPRRLRVGSEWYRVDLARSRNVGRMVDLGSRAHPTNSSGDMD